MQGYRRTLDHMSFDYVAIGLDVDSIPGWLSIDDGLISKIRSLNDRYKQQHVIKYPNTLDFKSIEFIVDTIKPVYYKSINRFPKDDKLKL